MRLQLFFIPLLLLLHDCCCQSITRFDELRSAAENSHASSSDIGAAIKPTVVPKYIALTFDDGPHQILTPKLLDVAKAKGALFTFYMMGIKAEIHPDIVKRALDEGHEVANHAWDHPILSKLSLNDVSKQLRRTNAVLEKASNSTPLTMRPPYGNTNKRLNTYIHNNDNLTVVMWSYDTNDWKKPGHTVLVDRVIKNVKAGDVILCHDIHPETIQAVPYIIDAMQSKGYVFETVSKMIALESSMRQQKQKQEVSKS